MSNLRKCLDKRTATNSHIKIHLLDSDSLVHPTIFVKSIGRESRDSAVLPSVPSGVPTKDNTVSSALCF